MAPIDAFDVCWFPLGVGKDHVHEILVLPMPESRYTKSVQPDAAIDSN